MTTNPGEIGSLPRNLTLQSILALESVHYVCPMCNVHHQDLRTTTAESPGRHSRVRLLKGDPSPELGLPLLHSALIPASHAPNPKRSRRAAVVPGRGARKHQVEFMRKVVLYSGTLLLLGLWKCCVDMIESYFSQRMGSQFTF
jgi:hypothetical protein